jgi:chemotaxis protein MotB
MRKRKKDDSSGDGAYWMDTYGDMVTLLLTFFVLLFSFSTIDAQKWEEIVSSLSGTPFVAIQALDPGDVKADVQPLDETSWDLPEPTPSPDPSEQAENAMNQAKIAEIKEQFDELYDKIKSHVQINGLQDELNVEMNNNVILMTMNESALFDSGSAVLKPVAKEILPSICEILKQYDSLINWIRIEGHTDNVPIQNGQFKNNWELSDARAGSVRDYLLALEVNGFKLYPAGLGELHPIVPNDSKENQTHNRRVDFVIESILKDIED